MDLKKRHKINYNLSEKYSAWIIKYCSTTFETPLFFIWYTDINKDNTDKLLSFTNGNIFATNSLKNLKATVNSAFKNLTAFENLSPWLESLKDAEPIENCTYDIKSIEDSLEKNRLDIAAIENFSNFINLYGDFVRQDDKHNHLQVYAENALIKKTWDYYYEFIFWPRFNDKEKFELWDSPGLVIDTEELLLRLKDVIRVFEYNIKLVERAIV